jgi:hypothetical protein
METRTRIEIALRAGMVAHSILGLLRLKEPQLIKLQMSNAEEEMDDLKKYIKELTRDDRSRVE